MKWSKVRKQFPDRWVLFEAISATPVENITFTTPLMRILRLLSNPLLECMAYNED